MKTLKFIPIALLALLASCAGKKAIADADNPAVAKVTNTHDKTAAQKGGSVEQTAFMQSVADNQVYAKNIVADGSFKLETGSKKLSCDGVLRMRKDQIIRLQLLIPFIRTEVARIDFTPDYVLLVDRYHKEYIKTDYSKVSFLADNGISFYSLQALFWNQLFLPGEKSVSQQALKKFVADLTSAAQQVPVTLKHGNMNYEWSADKTTGRITQTTVSYSSAAHGNSQLVWKYDAFKPVGVKQFPSWQQFSFTTDATGKKQSGAITLKLGTPKTSADWDVETELSAKYKKIEAEDILKKITSLQ